MSANNIFLVGFMGAGKTTVGKLLAHRLGKKFVDMDRLIEEREQKSISLIFSERGEPEFRRIERDMVRELVARSGLVVGAGGGIVLDPANIADFNRSGRTICLLASPDEILRRVSATDERPLLEKGDKRERVLALLEKRRPLYDAIPDRVDTTKLSPAEVVEIIMLMLQE